MPHWIKRYIDWRAVISALIGAALIGLPASYVGNRVTAAQTENRLMSVERRVTSIPEGVQVATSADIEQLRREMYELLIKQAELMKTLADQQDKRMLGLERNQELLLSYMLRRNGWRKESTNAPDTDNSSSSVASAILRVPKRAGSAVKSASVSTLKRLSSVLPGRKAGSRTPQQSRANTKDGSGKLTANGKRSATR